MEDRHVTGKEGIDLIRGRVMDAIYVIDGEYLTPILERSPKPGGRIAKTYEALQDGPQTGHYLYAHGNHMPDTEGKPPMSKSDFKAHLQWMVGKSRLHVVSAPLKWGLVRQTNVGPVLGLLCGGWSDEIPLTKEQAEEVDALRSAEDVLDFVRTVGGAED